VLTIARAVMSLLVESVRPLLAGYDAIYLWVGVITAIGSLPILIIPWLRTTTKR